MNAASRLHVRALKPFQKVAAHKSPQRSVPPRWRVVCGEAPRHGHRGRSRFLVRGACGARRGTVRVRGRRRRHGAFATVLAHLHACRVGGTWGCRPGLRVGDMSPLPNTMSKRAPGAPPRAWPAAAGGRTAFPSSRGRAADRASRRRPAPPQDLCPGKRRVARRYHNPPLPSHTWRARRRVVQRVRRSRGLLLRQVACARCCCWRQARRRGAARLAAR